MNSMNKTWPGILLLLFLAALLLSLPLTSAALAKKGELEVRLTRRAAITVCASGCDHTTIQDAIDAANPSDTIEVQAGTYLENLTIDKDITLQGVDKTTTIIDGQSQATVVTISPNATVTIADVTIRNGLGNNEGSGTDDGGGIFSEGSLTVLRSTITDNKADFNGAGGGIWNGGTLTVTKSSISHNIANGNGDEGNQGGGIYNHSDGQLKLESVFLSRNTSGRGAGVRNFGTMEVTNGRFDDHNGRGIDNGFGATAILNSCGVYENSHGGINNSGSLTLNSSTVAYNEGAFGGGGGIRNDGGTLLLNNSSVMANRVFDELSGGPTDDGGGIYNSRGTVELINSSVSDNKANHRGGGIYNSGELLVSKSTINGNMAIDEGGVGTGLGGGIYNIGGSVAITNSTISQNVADNLGQGGGIHNFGATGTLTVHFSTINENSASAEGGGIYNAAGTVTLSNSIVANSANGEECFNDSAASGTVNDDGFNIVEDNSCGFSGGSDPLLGELADNGGPTFTHLPENSSPAIDNGDCSATSITSDQRGIARPQGAACDIGAVEVAPSSPNSCGGLVQEAEDGVLSGYFEIGIDDNGTASGGQYIHVPESMGNRWNGPDSAHKADYCFTVETAGVYRIKGRIYAETGMDNSFFVKVDGSPINGYLWDFPKNTEYQIDEVSNRNGDDPVQVTLSEGEHTVEIFLREDGARLDTLELELMAPVDPTPLVCDDLVAEAEEGRLTGAFTIGDDSNASGGQYVHVPESMGNSFNTPNPAHQAEYCFNVETAGTYRLTGGIYADTGQDNSFFVKVDDAPSGGYLWDFPKNTDYQEDHVSDRNGADPVEVELQTGPITVTVFLREDGARLDKLELVHVGTPSEVAVNEPMARGILGTLMLDDYQGAEEVDLAGIKVTLQDADTRLDEGLQDTAYNETTETDHLGNYYFDEMAIGNYQLTLELPNGYQVSESSEVSVATDADEMVEQSFDLQITEDEEMKIYLPLVIRQ